MRIDAGHRGWAVFTVVATVLMLAGYVAYARACGDIGGPSGDTLVGLAYGLAGTLMIVFAGLLAARKKMITVRIGSLSWWLKGHLWLGALSLPAILFHAAFAFGGTLTTVLMVLLIVVVVSGLFGALLQHVVPQIITSETPVEESTYEQLDRARANLRQEAYELVWAVCGSEPELAQEKTAIAEQIGSQPKKPPRDVLQKAGTLEGQQAFGEFYGRVVVSYLRDPRNGDAVLASEHRAAMMFDELRMRLDPQLHGFAGQLQTICADARQKPAQAILHRLLHIWQILHIPLSMALLVLIAFHAVLALYY